MLHKNIGDFSICAFAYVKVYSIKENAWHQHKHVVKYHLCVKKNTLQVVFFMVESVEEIVELSLLYDFYGEMLDEHKKKIFEDFIQLAREM